MKRLAVAIALSLTAFGAPLADADQDQFSAGEFIATAAHNVCPQYYDMVRQWADSQ